jgi:hypothetical protein
MRQTSRTVRKHQTTAAPRYTSSFFFLGTTPSAAYVKRINETDWRHRHDVFCLRHHLRPGILPPEAPMTNGTRSSSASPASAVTTAPQSAGSQAHSLTGHSPLPAGWLPINRIPSFDCHLNHLNKRETREDLQPIAPSMRSSSIRPLIFLLPPQQLLPAMLVLVHW